MTTVYLHVERDGRLVPADQEARDALAAARYRVGLLLKGKLTRARDEREYGQWKKAHQLGTFIAQNLEEFERFTDPRTNRSDAHAALKHLQFLSGVECDDTTIELPDGTRMVHRAPRSLAFDAMGEERFQKAYSGFCNYLIKRWWNDMDEASIADAASLVGLSA